MEEILDPEELEQLVRVRNTRNIEMENNNNAAAGLGIDSKDEGKVKDEHDQRQRPMKRGGKSVYHERHEHDQIPQRGATSVHHGGGQTKSIEELKAEHESWKNLPKYETFEER